MDFKKMLSAPLHAGQAVVRDLSNTQPEQDAAKEQVLKLLGNDATKFMPSQDAAPQDFQLPPLNDQLTEDAQSRKADAEAAGEPFVPTEDDYQDKGPYGYLHKKAIHDALTEYEQEIQKNRPHIDYEGLLRQRLKDMAGGPEEHKTNPLYNFAMAMGNPEHAQELVATHNKAEADANAKQTQRWQDLLDQKQQAIEASIKQAMAEGDARKVVSSKWLESLAQIEQDKAKLSGQMQQLGEKNAGAERRAQLRGQWAVEAVKQRANAMLQGVGIRNNSEEWRTMQNNARTMLDTLVKKGATYEEAYDQVDSWLHDQLENRPTQQTAPVAPAGAAPAVAPAGASTNPMEAEINRMRGKKP
jgi:hypothetical protein